VSRPRGISFSNASERKMTNQYPPRDAGRKRILPQVRGRLSSLLAIVSAKTWPFLRLILCRQTGIFLLAHTHADWGRSREARVPDIRMMASLFLYLGLVIITASSTHDPSLQQTVSVSCACSLSVSSPLSEIFAFLSPLSCAFLAFSLLSYQL
jgi:hypothetical protein